MALDPVPPASYRRRLIPTGAGQRQRCLTDDPPSGRRGYGSLSDPSGRAPLTSLDPSAAKEICSGYESTGRLNTMVPQAHSLPDAGLRRQAMARTVLNAAAGWSLGHQRPSEAQTLDPLGVWVERPVALSQKSGRVTRCASHGTGVEPNSLTIRTARGVCAWTRNRCRHRLESLGERLPQYAFGT